MTGRAFNPEYRGTTTRLVFRCPEHGAFEVDAQSSRVASAPPTPLTAGCPVEVPAVIPFDLALNGRCARVSPWVRANADDDPGDESR